MVEAPLDLQRTLTIPQDHYEACAAAAPPVATVGNAAGNTINLLDLSGEPAPPAPLPDGFTARGIVALVFSCVSGILGTAVVAWYGLVGEDAASKATGAVAGEHGRGSGGGGVLQQQGGGATGGDGHGAEQITVPHGGGAEASKT